MRQSHPKPLLQKRQKSTGLESKPGPGGVDRVDRLPWAQGVIGEQLHQAAVGDFVRGQQPVDGEHATTCHGGGDQGHAVVDLDAAGHPHGGADAVLGKAPFVKHACAAAVNQTIMCGQVCWGLRGAPAREVSGGSDQHARVVAQLARDQGGVFQVVATTSTDNVAMVRALGADTVIDYKTHKFEDAVHDCDLVFDTLGGATRERSYSVLKKGSLLVSVIAPPDTSGTAERLGVKSEVFFMWPTGAQLAHIGKLVEQGIVKPVIDKTFTLDQTQQALDYLQLGWAKGKVVVTVK